MKLLPLAGWWLKADAIDVVSRIYKSIDLEWSGDADLNDRKVQRMRIMYLNRLTFIANIGIQREHLDELLSTVETEMEEDLTFLSSGIIALAVDANTIIEFQ